MSEAEPKCIECSKQYFELLAKYRKNRKKMKKLKNSFARIEKELLNIRSEFAAFIIGEYESNHGGARNNVGT